MPRDMIPVTMVKEFAWCPAIPWIIYNYGLEPPLTPSMRQGVEFQRSFDRGSVAEKLGLEPPVELQVYLEDRGLGIYGVVDIVAGRKRKTVVEVKAFSRSIKRSEHFKIQLHAYALMMVRRGVPVDRAILLLGENRYDFVVTKEKLEEVRSVVSKLWRTILSPEPPKVSQDERKCMYCRYRRFCPTTAS